MINFLYVELVVGMMAVCNLENFNVETRVQ